jgi:hypothetical protein
MELFEQFFLSGLFLVFFAEVLRLEFLVPFLLLSVELLHLLPHLLLSLQLQPLECSHFGLVSCYPSLEIVSLLQQLVSLSLHLLGEGFLSRSPLLHVDQLLLYTLTLLAFPLHCLFPLLLLSQQQPIILGGHILPETDLLPADLVPDLLHLALNIPLYLALCTGQLLCIGLINLPHLLLVHPPIPFLVLCQLLTLHLLEIFVHFSEFCLVGLLYLFYLVDVGMVTVLVTGYELVHFRLHLELLLFRPLCVLLLQPNHLFLELCLLLLVTLLVTTVNVRLQGLLLLLSLLKGPLLVVGQLSLELQLVLALELLNCGLLTLLCFFDVLVGRLDDG